jgi:hypothetical protein
MREHFLIRVVAGLVVIALGVIILRADEPPTAPASARTVVVPSNVAWTNTRITVTRGQRLRFEPSGEVRLSFDASDVAHAGGAVTPRQNGNAPISTTPVGALIGRIGHGQPFPIGDSTNTFDMPASGRLFLGVNDDHVEDNSGNFVVKIWDPGKP